MKYQEDKLTAKEMEKAARSARRKALQARLRKPSLSSVLLLLANGKQALS